MNRSIPELFVILALNPLKGRIAINNLHYRYTLTGAMFMDFLYNGEIVLENKRVIPSFRQNGEIIHDMFAERITKSGRNRRIIFWIKRFSYKSRTVSKEIMTSLERQSIIRIEQKKFLGFIPYNKYWFNDPGIRINLIEQLRGILLYGKQADKKDLMLLGLIDAAKCYDILAREKGESKSLRKKSTELLKSDILTSELNRTIREVKAAITISVTAAAMASHGSH